MKKYIFILLILLLASPVFAGRSMTVTSGADGEPTSGGLSNIVEDTTPQLGGNLDGQAYSMDTTGLLSGGIATNTKSSAYTVGADNAREKYRGVIYVSGVTTITLPAIGAGMGVCIYSTDANIKSISPNASDRIVLDGTALADDTDIDSSGVAGEFACVLYDSAAGWTVWGKGGTWASE